MLTIIRLLTWNISYQAMYGIHSKAVDATVCMSNGFNQCRRNVLNKISSIPDLDFILLQEPVLSEFQNQDEWNKLLQTHDYIHHKSGKEDMITLYNKNKFTISVTKGGEFEYGRPFQVTIFKYKNSQKINDKIVVVNLHAPHQDLWFLEKLNLFNLGYPIIIGGDFNNSVTKEIKINEINFKNEGSFIKQINTCCDHTLNGLDVSKCFDHILVSDKIHFGKVEYPILSGENIKHSDHLPVYGELIIDENLEGGTKKMKRIGLDFDGVLHKLIVKTEENGQRHSDYTVSIDVLKDNRFEKIIKLIEELQNDNVIKIISSRENQEQVDDFVNDKTYFNINVEVIKNARSAEKTDIVLEEVDEFYDDSANVLREIMKKGKGNIKLFFVIPELNNWYEVKTEKDIDKKLMKVEIINLIKELKDLY